MKEPLEDERISTGMCEACRDKAREQIEQYKERRRQQGNEKDHG